MTLSFNIARYMTMSMYEEKQLLNRLNALGDAIHRNPKINRLKRKLTVRQLKRERNLPLFNLDAEMKKIIDNEIGLPEVCLKVT